MIATDPLSLVFIFCFLLGFGFFIALALLGGHGHAHGAQHAIDGQAHAAPMHSTSAGHHAHVHLPGHGGSHATGHHGGQNHPQHGHFSLLAYFNPTSIALFLLGFGFFGYFFHNTTPLTASVPLLCSIGCGLVISILLLLLFNRIFVNSEGSTEQDVVDRTGMIGRVSITIPEHGIGEIIYTSPGGLRKCIPARGLGNQRLDRESEVVVVDYQNGIAEVDTWDHFIHETTDAPGLDDLWRMHAAESQSSPQEMEMVMRQEPKQE